MNEKKMTGAALPTAVRNTQPPGVRKVPGLGQALVKMVDPKGVKRKRVDPLPSVPLAVLALVIALVLMMGWSAVAQTTNPPGIRPVSGVTSNTNAPGSGGISSGGVAPSTYASLRLNTNGSVIWPPYFWETNAASAGVVAGRNGSTTNLTIKGGSFTGTLLPGATNAAGETPVFGSVEKTKLDWYLGLATDNEAAFALTNTINTLRNSNTFTVMTFGDSLSIGGDELGQGPGIPLIEALVARYGWAGAHVLGSARGLVGATGLTFPWGGAYGASNYLDSTTTCWWAPSFAIAAPGSVLLYNWKNTDRCWNANRFGFWYLAGAGQGTFKLQSSTNSATVFGDQLTVDASVGGGATRLVYTNILLGGGASDANRYSVRAMGSSGTNLISGFSVINDSASGVRVAEIGDGGINLTTLLALPRATLDSALTNMNPQLIIYGMKERSDTTLTVFSNNLVLLDGLFRSNCPNADVIYVGPTVDFNLTYKVLSQQERDILKAFCLSVGRRFFDSAKYLSDVDTVAYDMYNDGGVHWRSNAVRYLGATLTAQVLRDATLPGVPLTRVKSFLSDGGYNYTVSSPAANWCSDLAPGNMMLLSAAREDYSPGPFFVTDSVVVTSGNQGTMYQRIPTGRGFRKVRATATFCGTTGVTNLFFGVQWYGFTYSPYNKRMQTSGYAGIVTNLTDGYMQSLTWTQEFANDVDPRSLGIVINNTAQAAGPTNNVHVVDVQLQAVP